MADPHGTPGLTQRSGMVSLDLPDGAVPMHPGGVDDHHVTLAFLGDDVDDRALMHAVVTVRRAAAEHGPITLGVGGLGTFDPGPHSDGKTPAYVPVTKTAGLAALRQSVGHLDTSGRPTWTPHITLAYLDDPADTPAPVDRRDIPVHSITVHRGDDAWAFPLRGNGVPPAGMKISGGGIVPGMDIIKVGPKGYIHGWIFVGVPGVGAEVYHPQHGRGKITAHDGKSVTVAFHGGKTHRFTAKPSKGTEHHFEPRSGNAVSHGHLADRVVRDQKEIKGLKDDELKGVDKELTDRAAALGHAGRVTKTHQKVKDEIARRGKEPEKPKADYDALRSAADRYDAGSPTGRGTRVYDDPAKQKEAIRLHTAARRAAPDAASKKRHTQQIQRHQQYLNQIENNQNLKDFEQDKEATGAKLKELDRHNQGSNPDVYDEMAATHDHMADIHQKRAEQMEAAGLGGRNAYDKTVERHRDLAQIHRENASGLREKHEAFRQHVASRMANAEILVGQREDLARQTGKKKDIEHAIAGHEEIARNARGADMHDVADRHDAAAANLRDELARQTAAGSAMAARDKDMQRRKNSEIDHAQRVLAALDKRPDAGGGPEQREAMREAANASAATAGRGGTAKAHEAAAAAYRRYADLAEQGGDKKSADIARGPLAGFHDEMAAHIKARRAAGAAVREGFTDGGKKPSSPKKPGADSAPEDEKIDSAWGKLHPADLMLDHYGNGLNDSKHYNDAIKELDRRGATPEGKDKVSRARRKAAEDLKNYEAFRAEYDKPGGRGEMHRVQGEASRLSTEADEKNTSAAHAAAAEAHQRARTLSYRHEPGAVQTQNYHKASIDYHEAKARQLRATEPPSPEKVAAYDEASRAAFTATSEAERVDAHPSHDDVVESAHQEARLAHEKAARLATTDQQRTAHTRIAADHKAAENAAATRRDAEYEKQEAQRQAVAKYKDAATKADAASEKARQEPTALNHATAAEAHREAGAVATNLGEAQHHIAAASDHEAKAAASTHIAPGNRDDDKAAAELAHKKAQRTGSLDDHIAANHAYVKIANDEGVNRYDRVSAKSRAADHANAAEAINEADDHENDAKIHADAAERTQDADAHRAAAEAYKNAAESLDAVPGTTKRRNALTASAGKHTAAAAETDRKTAAYADAFTAANRASNQANRTHDPADHAKATAAHRHAASLAMTPHQSAYHLGEAGNQQAKATGGVSRGSSIVPSMNTKITAAQRKALQTIMDNPTRVPVGQKAPKGMIGINGNTAASLMDQGLIRRVTHGVRTGGGGNTYDLQHWELTDKGRTALSA